MCHTQRSPFRVQVFAKAHQTRGANRRAEGVKESLEQQAFRVPALAGSFSDAQRRQEFRPADVDDYCASVRVVWRGVAEERGPRMLARA
jgi:hypothetical protein